MSFTPPPEAGPDTGVMDAVAEGPTLVIRLGAGRTGDYYSVAGERTTIGRAPECDFSLADVRVWRAHGVLERQPDGIHVRDLGSLNGTYVNRERVEERRPADGEKAPGRTYRLRSH